MPELPEVETTTKGLRKETLGLKILDVWTDLDTKDKRKHDTVSNPKYFKTFRKEVIGAKIIKVERRAKNILIHLSNKKTILVHMKMTGRLLVANFDKFVHVIFYLSKGKKLAFSDPRKFGKITLFNTKEIEINRHLQNLGPEPLSESFTIDKFKERLTKKPNGNIKTVLMDQSVVVGIGNIYSDEILWNSNVHPERKVSSLTPNDIKNMFHATKENLKKGIDFGGDSMSDYKNIYGLKGEFQIHHEAYRRNGELCRHKKCQNKKSVIIRKMVNNRSAHFCNIHQI